jgi:hypothetical protein
LPKGNSIDLVVYQSRCFFVINPGFSERYLL